MTVGTVKWFNANKVDLPGELGVFAPPGLR
jgi:hypothetical protein